MKNFLKKYKLILMEAAVVERLRRSSSVTLHPSLVHSPLIYDDLGKEVIKKIYEEYIDIAFDADVPFLMYTPTWRTNCFRVQEIESYQSINKDSVSFMLKIRETHRPDEGIIKIGGMIGSKNDCYDPKEGLSISEAEEFHSWQINQLADTGVDYLIAATLPSVAEAAGIAKSMEKTGLPYIISFVISREGNVLDGTNLCDAIDHIDKSTRLKPLGFMVNCSYPTFLCANKQPVKVFNRLIGYQSNASALDYADLEGSEHLNIEDVSDWGEEMLILNRSYGIKILGGCCGTDTQHLKFIVDNMNS